MAKVSPFFMMNTLADQVLRDARRFLSVKEIASVLNRSAYTIYRWLEKGGADPLIIATLNARIYESGGGDIKPSEFKFIDLFAGIGGLRRAFENQNGECVWTSEWNKYAVQTYKANFPSKHDIVGDITQIDAEDVPNHDVLLAGFPCQPFSLAGVSKKNSLGREHGFRDATQGTLFFDVARILDVKRPKGFLLENVKNLCSHDNGQTFEVIRKTLSEELGYTIHYKVINASSWLPQQRQRIVIIGFREKTSFDWADLRQPVSGPKLESILHSTDEDAEFPYTEPKGGKAVVSPRYTLTDHLWNYLQNYAKKHAAKGNGFGCSVFGPDDVARTLSARYYKDGSEILISQGSKRNPRRLTPRECARLMGFDFAESQRMKIPVSDTQAYKQFGNSVAVPVFMEVARIMMPHISKITEASVELRPPSSMFQPSLFAV